MIYLFILLAVFWFLLSGYLKLIIIIPGILTIFTAIYFYKRNKNITQQKYLQFTLWSFIKYLPWIIKEIILANIYTMKVILFKKDENIILYTTNKVCKNASKSVLYCNSVTITPGTIVLNLEKDVIAYHVITSELKEDIESLRMMNKVNKLQSK